MIVVVSLAGEILEIIYAILSELKVNVKTMISGSDEGICACCTTIVVLVQVFSLREKIQHICNACEGIEIT